MNYLSDMSHCTPASALSKVNKKSHWTLIPYETDEVSGVMIGRLDMQWSPAMRDFIDALQVTMGNGQGFVVDGRGLIIAHPDRALTLTPWEPGPRPGTILWTEPGGAAYVETTAQGASFLTYYGAIPGTTWAVAISIPYETVLDSVREIVTPIAVLLVRDDKPRHGGEPNREPGRVEDRARRHICGRAAWHRHLSASCLELRIPPGHGQKRGNAGGHHGHGPDHSWQGSAVWRLPAGQRDHGNKGHPGYAVGTADYGQ